MKIFEKSEKTPIPLH